MTFKIVTTFISKIIKIKIIVVLLIAGSSCAQRFKDDKREFYHYKQKLYLKALKQGYGTETIEKSFALITYTKSHVKNDKKQFTRKRTFTQYYKNAVNNLRLGKARKNLIANQLILNKVEKEFKVPRQYIVALWGIETGFGTRMGNFYTVNSLVNLAYDGRRKELFENEFFSSLDIIDQNGISPRKLKSSWAGAIGQCQFMPSTYLSYAVDYDGDGTEDIWETKADVFASMANYLSKIGWNNKTPYGYELKNNSLLQADLDAKKGKKIKLAKLVEKYDLKQIKNRTFSEYELEQNVGVIGYDKRIFITFDNFDVIKKWNYSNYFALTIGIFAEKIKT